jgi:hypothetical protein
MGSKTSIPILRAAIASDYPALRCASARAIGVLDDTAGIEHIAPALKTETDTRVLAAYAFALGRLKAEPYCCELLRILEACQEPAIRQEAAIAIAMLAGDEGEYVSLWRRLRGDYATGAAQAIWELKRPLEKARFGKAATAGIEEAAGAFASGDLVRGGTVLCSILDIAKGACTKSVHKDILAHCSTQIAESKSEKKEYVLLAIHTLKTMLNGKAK